MENAILLASGMGVRMRPLTEKVPKPLICVDTIPMIETLINALEMRRINQIIVVVGYLGDQFGYLTKKYPNVSLVQNCFYETQNNISSAFVARQILLQGSCFVCEADLFVADKHVLQAQLNESCYFGKLVKGRTLDWAFELDENNCICKIKKGGTDLYNMTGVAYFTAHDATILHDVIREAYDQKDGKQLFWDEAVDRYIDRFKLKIHQVEADQIVEIDTPAELDMVKRRFVPGEK